MGNHHHARRAGAVVLGQQRPADGRADAEQLEVIAGHDLTDRHSRLI